MTFYEQQLKRYSLLSYDAFSDAFLTNENHLYPKKPLGNFKSPGGGKTLDAILHLDHYYSYPENADYTSIIIPASTKELRDNFIDRVEQFNAESKLTFSYIAVTNPDELQHAIDSGFQVIIILPKLLKNYLTVFKQTKIGYLVVDEAHEWYFEKTIQTIISDLKPKYQLLLTGTPFPFNKDKDKYYCNYVSLSDLRGIGRIHNFRVEIVSSTYQRKPSDWRSAYGNLRSDVKYTLDTDRQALESVCKEMIKHLQLPQYAKNFNILNRTTNNALSVLGAIDQTIIYCDAIKQAKHIFNILNEYKLLKDKVLLSTSEDDIDAEMIGKFKYNLEYKILILCDRARKGFNMVELFNIVDFTMTFNPTVQYQMFRIGRISKLQPKKQKIFFKVASVNNADWVKAFMTAVLALTQNEYYETFTGDAGKLPVPVIRSTEEDKSSRTKRKRGASNNIKLTAASLRVDLPIDCDFWTDYLHKQKDVYATTAVTELDAIRKYFFDIRDKVPKTIGRVMQSVDEAVTEGKTFQDWAFRENGKIGKRGKPLVTSTQMYNYALHLNIMDDVLKKFGYPVSSINVKKLSDEQLIKMFIEKRQLPEAEGWMRTKKWDQNAAQVDVWTLMYEIRWRKLEGHKLMKANLLKRGTQEHNIILQYRYDEKSGKAIYEAKYDTITEATVAQGLAPQRSPILVGNINRHNLKKGIYAVNRQGKIFLRKNGTILRSFEIKTKERKPRSDKGQWKKGEWEKKRKFTLAMKKK